MKQPAMMTDRHVQEGARALLDRFAEARTQTLPSCNCLNVHRHKSRRPYEVVSALMLGFIKYEIRGADILLRLTPAGETALAQLFAEEN